MSSVVRAARARLRRRLSRADRWTLVAVLVGLLVVAVAGFAPAYGCHPDGDGPGAGVRRMDSAATVGSDDRIEKEPIRGAGG